MANGTIAFDTLTTSDSKNTGTEKSIDTSYLYNGVNKFWMQTQGDLITDNIQDSFNSSTVTDIGTGFINTNFTNSFANTGYATSNIGMNGDHILNGANEIDNHFREKPFDKNIPVVLACLGILYNNFHNCETHAIFPYDDYLKYLPMYLQQADMESNGKNISKDSSEVNYNTGPILWGDVGTNGQHSFFQLIHQGTKKIPCDFVGFVNTVDSEGRMPGEANYKVKEALLPSLTNAIKSKQYLKLDNEGKYQYLEDILNDRRDGAREKLFSSGRLGSLFARDNPDIQ